MTKFASQTVAALLLAAVISTAYSQEKQIYSWTDENGVVHFVDTPPGNDDAVEIEVDTTAPVSSNNPYATDESTSGASDNGSDAPLSYADQKREEFAKARQEQAAAEADANRLCQNARQELERLEPSRRVYYTNAEGETERMDDVERVDRVADLKSQVQQYCK